LDINDQGQVVGVSFPSGHAFIYENDKIRDLNSLLPKDSPLLLLFAGGINDRGEITGEACVVANGACTSDQPAFLAIPDPGFGADTSAEDTNSEAGSITVPESVYQRVMRKLAFGHIGAEPARSQ
jgi:probable HAF family extracellular repeat protein